MPKNEKKDSGAVKTSKTTKKKSTSTKKGKGSAATKKKSKDVPAKPKTTPSKKKVTPKKKNPPPSEKRTASKKKRSDKGKERVETSSSDCDFDVLIVGGGLSGLTTAYYLLKGHPDLKIGLFEAASVLGGRTYSTQIETSPGGEKIPVSIGGTWVMLEDWATLALARDVDCMPFKPELHPQYITPQLLLGPLLFLKLFLLGMKIIKESPHGEEWWNSPQAKELDKITLGEWLDQQLLTTNLGRNAIRTYFILIENFQTFSSISALWAAVALYVRLFVVPKDIFKHFHIPSTMRWHGGTGLFIDAVVNAIRGMGGELTPNIGVTQIDQTNPEKVFVTLHNRENHEFRTVSAKRVVVATAISSAVFGIKYLPALPEFQSTVGQSVIGTHFASLNVVLMYERDWWTEEGQGMAILPDLLVDGPRDDSLTSVKGFGEVMDLTDKNYCNKDGHPFGVVRILSNPGAVAGKTDEEIKDHAIKFLQHYYDKKYHDRIANISNYLIWRWTDRAPQLPAVTFQFSVGVMSYYGDWMRAPFDRVFWGGSERARSGFNWMEGAIQRGMHVAAECAANLMDSDSPLESYWGQMPNHIRDRLSQSTLEPPEHLSEAYAGMAATAEPIKHKWDFTEEFRVIEKLGPENKEAALAFIKELQEIDPTFEAEFSRLDIAVQHATHLPNSPFEGGDFFSAPDPYVRVSYNDLHKQTSSRKNERDPVWDEKIRLPMPSSEDVGNIIHFRVMNKNNLVDTQLGHGKLTIDEELLSALNSGRKLFKTLKLGGKKDKSTLSVVLSVQLHRIGD